MKNKSLYDIKSELVDIFDFEALNKSMYRNLRYIMNFPIVKQRDDFTLVLELIQMLSVQNELLINWKEVIFYMLGHLPKQKAIS
ncbi:hypothetical protein U5U50_01025 [Mycoplasma sp. 888]|uniref:hypothetical protein n=1 Tax=Mycoplasma sp. 888 TaxID=3108483 RepID=UPI002D789D5E|nr:hypothetical protein [Mycoplasma sp. 888]WRQ25968.1 hypothetical protein U5U50_01025 [Mycoplasma sp. 888]